MTRYILDTNIFNRLLDDGASCQYFEGLELVGTYVQRLEIEDTPQEYQIRRENLLEIFAAFTPETELPYTTRWGDPWGGRWSAVDGLYEQILAEVRQLDKATGKKKRKGNQERDAQIGETAIKANLTLVSDDENLRNAVIVFGGSALSMEELKPAVQSASKNDPVLAN